MRTTGREDNWPWNEQWHQFDNGQIVAYMRQHRPQSKAEHCPDQDDVPSIMADNPNKPHLHTKVVTPRDTIFGYVEELTDSHGHGHPLPKDVDPLREWIASLWEFVLKEGLAEKGVFVEVPRLSSKASATRCGNMLQEQGFTGDRKVFDDIVEIRTAYSEKDVAMHLDGLLNQHGAAVLLCVVEGQVSVFTKMLGTKFPKQFLHKCRTMVHIEPETTVAWYPTVDAQPVETVAATALYGSTHPETKPSFVAGGKLFLLRRKFLGVSHAAPD